MNRRELPIFELETSLTAALRQHSRVVLQAPTKEDAHKEWEKDKSTPLCIIGDLSKVGLRPKLNFMQYVAFLDMLRKGRIPLGYAAWGSNSIRDVSAAAAHFFSGGPDDLARDPAVIAGIERADRLIDPDQRQNAWRTVLGRIQSEAYWHSIFTHTKYQAWSRDLNYTPTSDEIPQFYAAKWN